MMIGGRDAVARAEATAEAILRRTRRIFGERKLGDYLRSDIEVLGAESNWGAQARARGTREVILKLAVHHSDKAALEIFSREFLPSATSMAQGITGFAGGRPSVTPLVRLFSCLVPKSNLPVSVEVDGIAAPAPTFARKPSASPAPAARALAVRRRCCRPLDRRAAHRPGLRPQRRQGRCRQHRRAGPQARVRAPVAPAAHRGGGEALPRAFRARQGRAFRSARSARLQLPAARSARRRRHGLAAL